MVARRFLQSHPASSVVPVEDRTSGPSHVAPRQATRPSACAGHALRSSIAYTYSHALYDVRPLALSTHGSSARLSLSASSSRTLYPRHYQSRIEDCTRLPHRLSLIARQHAGLHAHAWPFDRRVHTHGMCRCSTARTLHADGRSQPPSVASHFARRAGSLTGRQHGGLLAHALPFDRRLTGGREKVVS